MSYSRTNPYIELHELMDELGMGPGDCLPGSVKEEQLLTAIDLASRWVDDYTRRDWYQHDHSVTPLRITKWSGRVFGNMLYLPHRNVITLTSVVEMGATLVAGTDYVELKDDQQRETVRLVRLAGIVSVGSSEQVDGAWVVGEIASEHIVITGKFGYEQDDASNVPADLPGHITQATRLVAAAFSGDNRKEITGIDGTPQSITDRSIPKTVFQILGPRQPVLPI